MKFCAEEPHLSGDVSEVLVWQRTRCVSFCRADCESFIRRSISGVGRKQPIRVVGCDVCSRRRPAEPRASLVVALSIALVAKRVSIFLQPRAKTGQLAALATLLARLVLRRCFGSGSRRVTREDEVAIFGWLVAGEALFVQRPIPGFAIRKVGESPAAGRGVLL